MIKSYKIKCDELLSIKEQVSKGICFINQASIQRWLCIPKWVIRWWAFILHLALFVFEKISKHRHSFWLYLLICTHMSQKMHHKYLWSMKNWYEIKLRVSNKRNIFIEVRSCSYLKKEDQLSLFFRKRHYIQTGNNLKKLHFIAIW